MSVNEESHKKRVERVDALQRFFAWLGENLIRRELKVASLPPSLSRPAASNLIRRELKALSNLREELETVHMNLIRRELKDYGVDHELERADYLLESHKKRVERPLPSPG